MIVFLIIKKMRKEQTYREKELMIKHIKNFENKFRSRNMRKVRGVLKDDHRVKFA